MARALSILCLLCLLSIPACTAHAARAPAELQARYEEFRSLQDDGRHAEAIEVGEDAIAYADAHLPPADDKRIILRSMLADSYTHFGLYRQGETLYREVLDVLVDRFGKDGPAPPFMIMIYTELAGNLSRQGKTTEAEAKADEAYRRQEAAGASEPDLLHTLETLAEIFNASNNAPKVNDTYRKIRKIHDDNGWGKDPQMAVYLYEWAEAIVSAFPDQARDLYTEAKSILEDGFQDAPVFVLVLTKLGHWYESSGDNDKARSLYDRATQVALEHHGKASIQFARASGQKALFLGANGEAEQGLKLIAGTLAIVAAVSGPESNEYRWFLQQATRMAIHQRRLDLGETWLFEMKALIQSRSGGRSTAMQAVYMLNASLDAMRGRWKSAAAQAEYAATMMIDQFAATSERPYELFQVDPLSHFHDPEAVGGSFLVTALMEGVGSVGETRLQRMWAAAQLYGQSAAAAAFSSLYQRMNQPPSLASKVRQRQDLEQILAIARTRLLELDTSPQRDRFRERIAALEDEVRRSEKEIAAIDATLKGSEIASTRAAEVTAMQLDRVRTTLAPDEALLMFQDIGSFEGLPQKLFAWTLTRESAQVFEVLAGPEAVRQMVDDIRRGMGVASSARGVVPIVAGAPSAPDSGSRLSSLLLGPAYSAIAAKARLLVVPSRSLSNLPFHLLPQPESAGGPAARWLIETHAFTVLPSVSALIAARGDKARIARHPSKSYLGFANPLLSGPSGTDKSAWQHEGCETAQPLRTASDASQPVLRAADLAPGPVRDINLLPPLPESLDEACAIAALFAERSTIRSGAKATEDEVRALDGDRQLATYDILHFASHALLSGEMGAGSEPAIVLTPPAGGGNTDGLLAASEVAGLHLDADWVILSACNTAAGNTADTEGLSGLARAFLYAGARSLLVSHWAVDSQAAVEIASRTVANFVANPKHGKAEALRAAILSLIQEGGNKANPRYWGPFVLVGDG